MQESILQELSSGAKTLGQLKDATLQTYPKLQQALQGLIEQDKVETCWSDDKLPAVVYRLKRTQPFWLQPSQS